MSNKQEILRDHYLGIARKMAAWAGTVAIMASALLPMSASAGQLTSRKAVLSNSAGAATAVAIDHFFTNSTTNTIQAIRFQYCTSPLYNTACTIPAGLVVGTTIVTQLNNGAAMTNAYASAASGAATDVLLTNATGNTFTAAQVIEFKLSGFTNPTALNSQFYIRVITCSTTTCSMGGADNKDNGAMAVSTSQTMSVTANVQESLVFCVGVTVNVGCSTVGAGTVTLAPNPMGATAASTGTAQMGAATNASSGYSITYNGTSFTDTTSDTIASAAAGGTVAAAGTEMFGFNLVANSGGELGTVGAAASGGTGAAGAGYNTNNTIAYSTAGAAAVASATGPTAQTTFTITYGANVANTTKPGVYTATQTFIATGTF